MIEVKSEKFKSVLMIWILTYVKLSPNETHTAKEVEEGMITRFENLRNKQQGELTAEELLKIFGIG